MAIGVVDEWPTAQAISTIQDSCTTVALFFVLYYRSDALLKFSLNSCLLWDWFTESQGQVFMHDFITWISRLYWNFQKGKHDDKRFKTVKMFRYVYPIATYHHVIRSNFQKNLPKVRLELSWRCNEFESFSVVILKKKLLNIKMWEFRYSQVPLFLNAHE